VPAWREGPLFDPLERLVIEYAERVTEAPSTVDDELVRRLLEHLDEAQLIELTMIVRLENVRSPFTPALGIAPQGSRTAARCLILEWK